MSIMSILKEKGIDVVKTDDLFKGYYTTDKGIVVSRDKEKCDKGIYFLLNTNKMNVLPCNDTELYVLTGTKYDHVENISKAKELAEKGKIFSFKSSDLYAEYYDFKGDEDLMCIFKYGYSAKSRKYIESTIKDIGLVRYVNCYDSVFEDKGESLEEFDIECKYNIWSDPTEIGKVADLWIAQTAYDGGFYKMYFDHLPSEHEVKTVFTIGNYERKPVDVFTCCECGNVINWLDLRGDIIDKYSMAKDRYCGCYFK